MNPDIPPVNAATSEVLKMNRKIQNNATPSNAEKRAGTSIYFIFALQKTKDIIQKIACFCQVRVVPYTSFESEDSQSLNDLVASGCPPLAGLASPLLLQKTKNEYPRRHAHDRGAEFRSILI